MDLAVHVREGFAATAAVDECVAPPEQLAHVPARGPLSAGGAAVH